MQTVRRLTLAALALAICLATSAKAQVLTLVPAESLVVIKVKNLQDLSTKIAALSQQWGLANIRPELNDPLGTILTMANVGPGLDKNGEAGVALLAPDGQPGEPHVILIPVSDFKAFAGSLPNNKAEGDLTAFSVDGLGSRFVADWGKFAAISPRKEMLAKKPAAMEIGGASSKELAGKDLVVYANMKAIRKLVLPEFQKNKGQVLQQIEQGIANAPNANAKFAPVLKAYLGQLMNVAEGFLTDTDGATFGINITKEGIATTLMADFAPTSYAGKAVAGLKGTDASFTAGLPEGRYFFYGGTTIGGATGMQLLNDFLAPIEKEVAALGADGKGITDYISATKEYLAVTKQMNFGMVAPAAAAIGQEGLIQAVAVIHGDSAKMTAAYRKAMESAGSIMKLSGADAAGVKTTATPGAKTVDGVTLDQYTTSFNGNPQNLQEQQVAGMLQMLYGPKGMNAYAGAVGADKTISVAGGSDALLSSAIKAAKENADPLGKGTAAKVAAALPQNRLATYFLPIDTIATTVLDVMAAKGVPGGVKLPPNLPPLGGAVATEGSAIRFEGYIPAQTVQSLIAAGMQMYLQGMQGGGAGQPGGL